MNQQADPDILMKICPYASRQPVWESHYLSILIKLSKASVRQEASDDKDTGKSLLPDSSRIPYLFQTRMPLKKHELKP